MIARLGDQPLGARVQRANGDAGTVVVTNYCRVRLQLDRRNVKEFDVIDAKTQAARHVVAASAIYVDLAPDADVAVLP